MAGFLFPATNRNLLFAFELAKAWYDRSSNRKDCAANPNANPHAVETFPLPNPRGGATASCEHIVTSSQAFPRLLIRALVLKEVYACRFCSIIITSGRHGWKFSRGIKFHAFRE